MKKYVVQDVGALKALAHPIRIAALGKLRSLGPATASELARELGESSGSLSYHLRQLERFGFVEDDVAKDGRERRWRACHDITELPTALTDTPEGRAGMKFITDYQQQRLGEKLTAAEAGDIQVLSHSDYFVQLSAADRRAMEHELDAVIMRYSELRTGPFSTWHVISFSKED